MADLNMSLDDIEELNRKYREKFGDFPPIAEMGGGKEAFERIQKAIEEDKKIMISYDDNILY